MSGDRSGELFDLLRHVLVSESPLAPFLPMRRAVDDTLLLHESGAVGSPNGVAAGHRHAIVLGPIDDDELGARAARFFGSRRVDSVELFAPRAGPLEAQLIQNGWSFEEEEEALALSSPPPEGPPRPPELTIDVVRVESALEDFRAVSQTGTHIIPSLEAACAPGVILLVGRVDGVPVATARTSIHPGHPTVADVMGITTRPEWRRRGIGTAMTLAVLRQAAAAGASGFVLTATPLGRPIYERIGFRPLGAFRTYLRPVA